MLNTDLHQHAQTCVYTPTYTSEQTHRRMCANSVCVCVYMNCNDQKDKIFSPFLLFSRTLDIAFLEIFAKCLHMFKGWGLAYILRSSAAFRNLQWSH